MGMSSIFKSETYLTNSLAAKRRARKHVYKYPNPYLSKKVLACARMHKESGAKAKRDNTINANYLSV